MAVVLISTCLGLTACKDIKTAEVKISANGTEYTLTINLYRHLAPKTCKQLESYISEGYYSNALIYKNTAYSSQLMFGDLKIDNGEVVQAEIKPQIYGEFDKNGTTGSDLVSEKGTIGLWRTWAGADADDNKYKATYGGDTGRATWYMPTDSIAGYTGYFCVFAKYDTSDSANSEAIDALTTVFSSSDNYKSYYIYYTGEYDASKENENYGLTFHCVLTSEYEKPDDLFEAKKSQLACYNRQTVYIAETTKIVSITLK